MRNVMQEMAKALASTFCQICYEPTEVIDGYGTWCRRCHKAFTDGFIDPSKRTTVVDLMKKYRSETEEKKKKK